MEPAGGCTRLLGTFGKTYGNNVALSPPPVRPPVAQVSDCQAVSVPSFFAPTLILAKTEGRLPAMVSSVARSRKSFTGRPPLSFDRLAHWKPQASAGNLLPNPPPM